MRIVTNVSLLVHRVSQDLRCKLIHKILAEQIKIRHDFDHH